MFAKLDRLVISLEYPLFEVATNADGTRSINPGPKRKIRFALVASHRKSDKVETFQSPPVVSCKCVGVQHPPDETGFIPGFVGEGEYAYCEHGGAKRPMTGVDVQKHVTNIVVHNRNSATFTIAPGPTERCFVPAGWELQCTSGGGQNVQLQEDLWIRSLPWPQTITVRIGPPYSHLYSAKLWTLCLEIGRPEPNERMRYRLVPPSRPSLARLARLVRGSAIRGPWDQARLWIATDHASHAKVQESLLQSPTAGFYLQLLHEAARALAIDPSHSEVK